MSDTITVQTFMTEVEAELARLRLVSDGIEAEVHSQDHLFAGAIGGVALIVNNKDEVRAQEILKTYEQEAKDAVDSAFSENEEED